jgi:hypothetical protein
MFQKRSGNEQGHVGAPLSPLDQKHDKNAPMQRKLVDTDASTK